MCGVGGLGALVPAPGGAPDVTEGKRNAAEGLAGTAPRLDKVSWSMICAGPDCRNPTGIVGVAHFSATHRPVELIAFAPQVEDRFQLTSCIEKETSVRFVIECRKDRGPYTVVYHLRVKDKLGRESNVVEKRLECPGGGG
jgi:hypothetical protein